MTKPGRRRFPSDLAGALAALAFGLGARPLGAAPLGAPVVQVVELWSSDADGRAEALTNALRDMVLDAPEFYLNTDNPQLVPTALDAKCDTRAFNGPLTEATGKGLLAKGCQARMAKRLGAKAGFFWGYVYLAPGGRRQVQAHLWQPDQERSVTLAYDEKDRRRLAERLYRHLVAPGKVGDVLVVGGAGLRGELFVNGRSAGLYEGGDVELTVALGEVTAEVRAGAKVVARGRAAVGKEAAGELRLEPVAEPAPVVAPAVATAPPVGPVVAPSRPASALPWVVAGVGAAGLVGAGAFFALRQDTKGDLRAACRDDKCPAPQDDRIARGDRYGALSLASFGVGVVALGAATYFFLDERTSGGAASSSRRSWAGVVAPSGGGGLVGVAGRF